MFKVHVTVLNSGVRMIKCCLFTLVLLIAYTCTISCMNTNVTDESRRKVQGL